MSELIKITNLCKSFHSKIALHDLSVSISKGKIVGLVGPDGAGKTTLIRLISALMIPSSGQITVAGFDSKEQAASIHQIIGYMPQRFGLYEDLTVEQNLNLYADLNHVIGNTRKTQFEKLLKFTNLARFTKFLAGNLSGGMKQKLGLACTLIRTPTQLLLDEPSVGVDPISRRELWKMVQELKDQGLSILWSTAYLDEAEKCDEVLLLNEGNLLYSGPPKELTQKMDHFTFKIQDHLQNKRAQLFELINDKNVIDGVIQGDSIRLVLKSQSQITSEYIPVPPRFEDAFINILGGCPKGKSELAENAPQIEKGNEFVIEVSNLTKQFGSLIAVNDLSFQIKKGEVFGLLGPNGAGKSTTFKMLCGLLKPTSGSASVNGRSLEKAPAKARAYIGYMAQKFSLYSNLTVLQNLHFFSENYSAPSHSVEKMIEIFKFHEFLHINASDLPLGFKQRLALACSCMHHPEVLFLDEPTSGVDPITRREFWNHINGLCQKGTTIVVTTHFMDEAEYCDRIGLIYQGKLITLGTPDHLKEISKTAENPTPSLEDAFIHLVEAFDGNHAKA